MHFDQFNKYNQKEKVDEFGLPVQELDKKEIYNLQQPRQKQPSNLGRPIQEFPIRTRMTEESLKEFGLAKELERSKNPINEQISKMSDQLVTQRPTKMLAQVPDSKIKLEEERGNNQQPSAMLNSLRDRPNNSPGRSAIGKLNLNFDDAISEKQIGEFQKNPEVEWQEKNQKEIERFSTPKTQSRQSAYNSRPNDSESPAPLMSPTNFGDLMAPPSPVPNTHRPFFVMNAEPQTKDLDVKLDARSDLLIQPSPAESPSKEKQLSKQNSLLGDNQKELMSPGGVLDQDFQKFSSNPDHLMIPESPTKVEKQDDLKDADQKQLGDSQSFRIKPLEASQGSQLNSDKKKDQDISLASSVAGGLDSPTKNQEGVLNNIETSLNSETAQFVSPETLPHQSELNFSKKTKSDEIEIPPTPSPAKFLEDDREHPAGEKNKITSAYQDQEGDKKGLVTPTKDSNSEFPLVRQPTETPESQLNKKADLLSPGSINMLGETPEPGLRPILAESTEVPETSPTGLSGTEFNLSPFSNLESTVPKLEDQSKPKSNPGNRNPVQTTEFKPDSLKSSNLIPEIEHDKNTQKSLIDDPAGGKDAAKPIPEMLKNSNPSMVIALDDEEEIKKDSVHASSSKVMAPPSPEKKGEEEPFNASKTPTKSTDTQKPTDKWRTPPISKNTPITEVIELDDLPPIDDELSNSIPIPAPANPPPKTQPQIVKPQPVPLKKATDKWKPVIDQKSIPITEVIELDDLPPINDP